MSNANSKSASDSDLMIILPLAAILAFLGTLAGSMM